METPAESHPEEPTSKKLKTSPSYKTPKYKRRKIALFFGYCGAGYQGMQKNIGAKTIEADLEEALYLSAAIPEQDRGHPKRLDWSRSARTDKGVSAVCQVVSGSFYIDPPGLIERLHRHLSSQFRVFGYKRVAPSFSAQRFCDRRRYVYLLPVFVFDLRRVLSNCESGNVVEGECDVDRFCYGEEEKERFNRILKCYEGTHNFHNFTTRIKAEDPSSQRFIVSFSASDTVVVDGIEFVKCQVVGQSFMLHQIRKLIGFAVLVMRNIVPESLIKIALQKDVNITVPTAPEVGLFLDECFFTSYNKKWKEVHGELSMKDYEKEAEEFKMKHIYSHIALTERKDRVVGLWLQSLNHENYSELSVASSSKIANLKDSEVRRTTNDKSSELEIAADLKSPEAKVTTDALALKLKTAEVEVVVD
ncbi:hypothetical protein DCAR_0519147 [Daucus carota subsp. sativus]|uniref:Pseudouridine synthase I TruA alpha/beta domain-containing protein n=1 Tax=Daucus carota subsp. sativus TaxID=79200 RepID=A0AAF0X3I6_DAUCS|nr:PREDICTED: tRNA pseudouridine synthase A, mitochondrial-like [Daucus carota subsp. sativus]XP_017249105.1 PREDICTED: tRNA pseudouridine synthase A, mitochondrial-like [Daucus carota subsp. sativus]XP_017249106.1 PREDICTED: tRNA pseudouridine synthase A, mitochondrial-like [Daucus carota subsp. sativus]XP_017249107.1 PREDICTED: tRNA pseudouridine synthase A, mitochondrial-like [Daucus carota subsp. sativus]XP_017249108.1 PREDICTED: tRNA pseudouridine synthase A, mitochondrial-like [Daucus car